MIISHKHKFIFLKTKKTAGTSIEIALSRFCGERDIITPISRADEQLREELSHRGAQNFYMPSTKYILEDRAGLKHLFLRTKKRPVRKHRYYNHIPARRVRTLIGARIWNEYFKFCFERNPWDRAISWYFWRTRGAGPRPSLLEFLRSIDTEDLSNFGIYSIDGEIAVDHVGLYENLDSELERIATLLNLPEKIQLPRAKATHRKDNRHYREIMGPEERSIVAQICAREIAHFGYSF